MCVMTHGCDVLLVVGLPSGDSNGFGREREWNRYLRPTNIGSGDEGHLQD